MSAMVLATIVQHQAEALQGLRGFWDEVSSEVVLLVLFCAGFALFRCTAIRELIPGGKGERRSKAAAQGDGQGGTRAGPAACPATSPVGSRKVPSKQLSGRSLGRRDATSASTSDVGACIPKTCARASVEARRLDEAGPCGIPMQGRSASSLLDAFPAFLSDWTSKPNHATCRLPSGSPSPELVTACLEHAAKTRDLDVVREVCRQASLQAFPLPSSPCEALLRACASAGDRKGVELFEELLRGGFEPSESALIAVVSLCAESRHVHLAERAVSYARRAHGRVSLALYSALMKVYGQARLWHKTCDLYEYMVQDSVEPDTVAYGSLIKAAVESGKPELARRFFKESGNPDLLNYMSLIRAAGREGDAPRALRLLDELERSPLSADATAYNCALEACAACNDRTAAEALLRRMERAGVVDVVSYNTYLKVLLAAGALTEVKGVLRDMKNRGFPPNVVTYNSMVRDSVARQDMQGAWAFVAGMECAGVKPDAFTCSILMKGVKHTSCSEEIDKVITLVQHAKVTPDEVLVNCLLDACVRLRDPQRLTQVLDQFKANGIVPSLHAYATFIRAYGHARRPERAWELWRELRQGRAAAPSEEAFAAMVEACLAGGDLGGAVAVFREVSEQLSGFPRAPSTFASCLKACVQFKQPRLALELYSEIKDRIVCGKVAYNTIIDALVRQGDIARAHDIFRDMALKNVTPDLITYSTLIKGHCARGDLEQGLQLLGLMQRRGIAPDAVLFNSILDGCAHKQMRMLTEQVLRDMEVAGIAPSNFTLSILAKLYGRCGDLEAAFHVVRTYPEKYGFRLNAQVFTCLMSACITNGELPRALEVYSWMISSGCAADGKTYQTLLGGCLRHSDSDAAARLLLDSIACGMAKHLESEVVDAVLLMASRRGRGVAVPLLSELRSAGVAVSDRTTLIIRRGDGSREPMPQLPPGRAGAS